MSAVTKSPTHPASAMGWTITSIPVGMLPKTRNVIKRITSESPNVIPAPGGTTETYDQRSPSHSAGMATIRPASGPATAMSKSELRSRAGERIRITAPRVPNRNRGGGTGMKYGGLAEPVAPSR